MVLSASLIHFWGMIEGIPTDGLAVPMQLPGASRFQYIIHPIAIMVSGLITAQSSLSFSHDCIVEFGIKNFEFCRNFDILCVRK